MSRGSRIVVPGTPHHITQRGVRQTNIFLDAADHLFYSDLLLDASRQYGMSIHSYTWMTNHVHIIAVPERENTFEKVFRKAHAEYARKFNKKYELRGYLWQDRFFSCPMDEAHYWAAIRYVERNPIRAGVVRRADEYRWSSARARCGLGRDRLLTDLPTHPLGVMDWSEWLAVPNPHELDGKIRKCTRGGWPCGDERFVENLESVYGRQLRPQKPGPKRIK
jgi:putative transposase